MKPLDMNFCFGFKTCNLIVKADPAIGPRNDNGNLFLKIWKH